LRPKKVYMDSKITVFQIAATENIPVREYSLKPYHESVMQH